MQTVLSHAVPPAPRYYRPLSISAFPQHARFTQPIQISPYVFQPRRIIVTPDATAKLYTSVCTQCGVLAELVCIECGERFCRRCQPGHGHEDEKMQDAGWYPLTVCILAMAVFLGLAWILGVG